MGGHRNEPARERHRMTMKRELSLTSLPLDDKRRRLTLENHFGWMVLQKCQVGDGNIPRYPQVVQYYEKPERSGPEYGKVTHVLYLKGKEDSLGREEKQVQTSVRNVSTGDPVIVVSEGPGRHKVTEEVIDRQRVIIEEKDGKPKKGEKKSEPKKSEEKKSRDDSTGRKNTKRKLIDTFYYKDPEERIFRPIGSKEAIQPESNPVVVENYVTEYVPDNKKPKKSRARSSPKSWQLRAAAGAEQGSGLTVYHPGEEEDEETGEQEWRRNEDWRQNEYLYRTKRDKSNKRVEGEVLWQSAGRTNEYLYLPARPGRNRS